jgi:SAM-dependent methyltransferase
MLATLFASAVSEPPGLIVQKRGFFGVLHVAEKVKPAPDGEDAMVRSFTHGTTLHGMQFRDLNNPERDLRLRGEPLTYYHRQGPIGHVFKTCNVADRPVGLIGLGTGTLAAYALPGQKIDIFEIDPLVRDLAFTDDSYFTYVADARKRGAHLSLLLGDARLMMERSSPSPANRYGLIVVDAFSSDAIPVHLITQEALRMYLERLQPDGILCFHISNRYLDLQPVLANLAQELGLAGFVGSGKEDPRVGRDASTWVMLARDPEHLARLLQPVGANGASSDVLGWQTLSPDPRVGIWTDDYSNLLSAFMRF